MRVSYHIACERALRSRRALRARRVGSVGRAHDRVEHRRKSARQGGGRSSRRPWTRKLAEHEARDRSGKISRRLVRSTWLRRVDAARERRIEAPRREHDVASRGRHGSAARASWNRSVARVGRFVGRDPCARVCAKTRRARDRDGADERDDVATRGNGLALSRAREIFPRSVAALFCARR